MIIVYEFRLPKSYRRVDCFETLQKKQNDALSFHFNGLKMVTENIKNYIKKILFKLKIIEDIAECKRVEEELSKSEQNYRNIFENAMDGIVTTSLKGNLVTLNNAFVKLTGYSNEDLL